MVRTLVAAVLAVLVAFALWMWWLSTLGDPYASPGFTLAIAYPPLFGAFLLTIVVVQASAVWRGRWPGNVNGECSTLADDAVSPREIVSGRLLGKLSQVGMIRRSPVCPSSPCWPHGTDFPSSSYSRSFCSCRRWVWRSGLAVSPSVISRRGRDELFSVYILMVVLVEPSADQCRSARRDCPMAGSVQPLYEYEPPGVGRER